MMKGQNVEMVRGDSRTIRVTVKDNARAPVDLTGATVKWWVGKSATAIGADVLLQRATGGQGIAITSPTTGVFDVTLAPADTQGVPPGEWYHEAEVTMNDGTVNTVLCGRFTLLPDLVHA